MGAAALFARLALTGAAPIAIAASRLTIAALLLGVVALFRPQRTDVNRPQAVTLACAGAALALHFASWIASLEYTSVAISTLLVSTTPMWTALYDALFARTPLPRPALIAFLAGAIGLVAIVRYDTTAPPHPGHELIGAALALTGAIAFAAYLTFVRHVRDDLGTRTIVTHTYAWAAMALIAVSACLHQAPPPPGATVAWAGILAMALVSQLLGHTAINASLRWFTSSTVAFTGLMEPLSAAVLALVFFGEAIPPLALIGGVVLLASIGIVLWTDPKRVLD